MPTIFTTLYMRMLIASRRIICDAVADGLNIMTYAVLARVLAKRRCAAALSAGQR